LGPPNIALHPSGRAGRGAVEFRAEGADRG
jgi:hypothetical protein